MKKINFLIAVGLMGAASAVQAQTIASLGFEAGDQKYATDGALTKGGVYGDWVNVLEGDVWNEQSTDDPKSGEYAFQMQTGSVSGNTWERGFKMGNLPIKGNTPYRVSFWIKADAEDGNPHLTSWLSKGIEYYDKSICTPSGYNFGVNDIVLDGTGWQHVSFVSFYANADVLNNVIAGQSWVGNSVYPEAWGGDGTITYAEYFGGQLPEKYFVIVNMTSGSTTYTLDDILVEEGVTFNEAAFNYNIVRLDFGYPTNIAALAKAQGGTLSLDPSCVSVTYNGEPAPIMSVEGKEDGYVYIFLDEIYTEDGDDIKVSFTPASDCPIVYNTDARPSSNYEGDMAVLGFEGEVAYYNENVDAMPSAWNNPKVVACVPEDGSFELDPATFTSVSVTYDQRLDLTYASAALEDSKGVQTDLSEGMTLSEDGMTVNIAIPAPLADGDYKVILANVASEIGFGDEIIELTYSVGEDHGTGSAEVVYALDLSAFGGNQLPSGWSGVSDGAVRVGNDADTGLAGAPRTMGDASNPNHGIYWGARGGSEGELAYGKAAIENMYSDGTMPEEWAPYSIFLTAGKYKVTYKNARWDGAEGNPYNVYVKNAEGTAVLAIENEEAAAMVGQGPDATVVVPAVSHDFNVEAAGYYYVQFTGNYGWGCWLLTSLEVSTMPSSIAAYYKQLLAAAVEEAEAVLATAESEEYNGETKSALAAAIERANTEHLTTPSAFNALIDELKDLSAKLTTRMDNIEKYTISLLNAIAAYDNLEGKYRDAELAVTAKALIDQYKEIDASALSDDVLNEVTPKLVTAAAQLDNVVSVVDALTWGAYKAYQTATNLGIDGSEGLAVVTDDRRVVNSLNAASTIALYKKIADKEDLTPYMEKVYSNYVYEVEDGEYNASGNPLIITGVNFTGLIQNPKLYTLATSNVVLANNTFPGWMCNQLEFEEGTFGEAKVSDPASVEKPVVDSKVNAYGSTAEYDFYQTIENAPVGVYDIYLETRTARNSYQNEEGETIDEPYNAQNDETGIWDKYIYAQVDDEEPIMVPFTAGGSFGATLSTVIPNVTVKEGQKLTIGAVEHYVSGKATKNGSPLTYWDTNTWVDDARIFFVAPLAGYDYAKAAEDLETSIETLDTEAPSVSAIYSISGAKQATLQKGINIVKYTNGKVEKVLVK